MEPHPGKTMEIEKAVTSEIHGSASTLEPLRRIRRYLYRNRGLLLAFVNAAWLSCLSLTVSSLKGDIGICELVFFRGSVASIVSFIFMCYNGEKIIVSSFQELKFYLANSAIITSALYFQYFAYQNMPAADATAINYSHVALTGVFGRIFLKEPLGIFEMVMVLLSFLGVVLIARPPFLFRFLEGETMGDDSLYSGGKVLPTISASMGSLMIASSYIVLRKMRKRDCNVMTICFYMMVPCALISVVSTTVAKEWTVPCSWTWLRVYLSAFAGYLGYVARAYALRVEDAIYVSLIGLNDLLIVLCVSVALFSYVPDWINILGVFLIFGSSVLILVRKMIITRMERNKRSQRGLSNTPECALSDPSGSMLNKQADDAKREI